LFSNKTRDEIVRKYGLDFYGSNYAFIKDSNILPYFIAQIRGLLKRKEGILLDVGSGFGLHSLILSNMGYKVFSLDLSKKLVKVHNALVSDYDKKITCSPILADALHLPIKDRSAEIVYVNEFISHVSNLSKSIKEICRVLKPGGELILSDVDRNSLLSMRNLLTRRYMDQRFMEARKEIVRNFLQQKGYAFTEHEIETLASKTAGLVEREVEETICEFLKGYRIEGIVKRFSRREPFYRKFKHRSPYGQYDERLFTPAEIVKLLELDFDNFRCFYIASPRLSRFMNYETLSTLQRSIFSKRLLSFMIRFSMGKYVIYGIRK